MITLPSGREIGFQKLAFIIAEVGSNWSTLDDISVSIQAAKNVGADAVKFQLFDNHALYGPQLGGAVIPLTVPGYTPGCLDPEWLPKMKAQCDRLQIEFMCSAFSPKLYDIVDPFINIHKVASAEMTHMRILEKLNTLNKPVILSTGASGLNDVTASISLLDKVPKILLYCVASYPAKEINLENISELHRISGLDCGFSDHSVDSTVIPRAAVDKGAVVIEKHFQAVKGNFPDSGHSLNYSGFKKMVGSIRNKQVPSIGYTPEEADMVSQHNRRLIAIKEIALGDLFEEEKNFGIYRSLKKDTHAFSPFLVNYVNGRVALRSIKLGDGIGPGDV